MLVAVVRIFNNEEITYSELLAKKKVRVVSKAIEKDDEFFEMDNPDNTEYNMDLNEYLILDIVHRSESGTTFKSPFEILRAKLLEAVRKRANQAFEVL